MQQPPVWTEAALRAAATEARAIFRTERLDEPLETWKRTFEQYEERFVVGERAIKESWAKAFSEFDIFYQQPTDGHGPWVMRQRLGPRKNP